MRKIFLFLAVIFFVNMLVGCTWSNPNNTIKKFEKTYNAGDINGMLDCFDPVMVKGIRAALNISEAFLSINPNDVLDLVPFLYTCFEGAPQVFINILKTRVVNDKAEILAEVKFVLEDQEDDIERVCFCMERHKGQWYIFDVIEDVQNL